MYAQTRCGAVVSLTRARCYGFLFSLAVSSAFLSLLSSKPVFVNSIFTSLSGSSCFCYINFFVDALSVTPHLMAEFADFSDVCTSAVFICGSCHCRWNLHGSECTDISEELLSAVCISLLTDTEVLPVLLLLETAAFTLSIDIVAARRFLAVAVVKISRASADEARARWQGNFGAQQAAR